MRKSTQSAIWSRWLAALAVLSLALVWTSGACAQTFVDPTTVRLTCGTSTTSACTSLTSGGVQQAILTANSSPTLEFTEQSSKTYSGEAFLVVLVPDTESSGLNFTVSEGSTSLVVNNLGSWDGSTSNGYNGKLLTTSSGTGFLGIAQGGAGVAGKFSSFTQISDHSTSTSVTGYTVYVVDLGSYSSTTNPISFSFGGSALPAGTVLWGFVANNGCTVKTFSSCTGVNSMPYSDSITITPEPASIVLLGAGLFLIGFVVRRQRLV